MAPTAPLARENGADELTHALAALSERMLSASTAVAYLVIGAAAILGRSVAETVGTAMSPVLAPDLGPALRHTLRIEQGDLHGAEPFADGGGATHRIVYGPAARYAKAALAHEFAHVLLAVIRGGPAEQVGVPPDPAAQITSAAAHVEECAAWALAKAITHGAIWRGAALTYRERVLDEHGVPLWARAPRIPPPMLPTRALVRWLAQVEP